MSGIPETNYRVIRAYGLLKPHIIKAQLTSDTRPLNIGRWFDYLPAPSHWRTTDNPVDPLTVVTRTIYLSHKADLFSAKTADLDPLYPPNSLWPDKYFEEVKKSGTINSAGASQGGTDSLPVLIKSSLINLDSKKVCVNPMCIELCTRLTSHASHNLSIEQSRNGHLHHPAHVAALAASTQEYFRCPIFGDNMALPVIARNIILPEYTTNTEREIDFGATADYVKEILRRSKSPLTPLEKFSLHQTDCYNALLMACQDKITLDPCFNLFLLVNYLALVLHHLGGIHRSYTRWLFVATQAAIAALTTHGVPCTPVTLGQIENLMSPYLPYSPPIPPSNTLHLTQLSAGATAPHNAPQSLAANYATADTVATSVTPETAALVKNMATAIIGSCQSLNRASRKLEDDAREQSLEDCTESIVEELAKTTKAEVKSTGEEITSTLISLFESLNSKMEENHSALQDDLKGQVDKMKETICSDLAAKQDSYHQGSLQATKKSNALLHESLDKISTLASAIEELTNENKSLAQQLKNCSVATQDGNTTPPSSVEDKNTSNSDLTGAHEIANAPIPAPETPHTPSKEKGPNLHDPSSADFNPSKGVE